MKILDVTEFLKSKFLGKSIKHKPSGALMYDGLTRTWTDASGTWTSVYEIGYGNLEFLGLDVKYYAMKPSIEIPMILPPRVYIFDNYLDIPEKKNISLVLTYTEAINASTTNSITEGRSSTFKADANFNFGVFGKASVGFSETITLSVQKSESKSQTKTNGKTETFQFTDDVPPKTSITIELTKELRTYEMPFDVKMIIDGDFFIIGTYIHNNVSNRQPVDKGWGKLSDYLTEEERTITINGLIEEVVGESTRKAVRSKPLTSDSGISEINALLNFNSIKINNKKMDTAEISLAYINAFDNGDFDVTFNVYTGNCTNSSCSGFDATLSLEVDDEIVYETYSFEGWTVADSGTSFFSITRQGNRVGLLRDVTSIENPEIICDDEI